jgi:hypothetical protein
MHRWYQHHHHQLTNHISTQPNTFQSSQTLLSKDHCPDAHYDPPQPRRTLIVTTTTIATSKAPAASITTTSLTTRIPFEAVSIVTEAASDRLLRAHAAHAAAEACIVTAKACWRLLVQAGSR